MKLKLLLIPLALFSLVGCDQRKEQNTESNFIELKEINNSTCNMSIGGNESKLFSLANEFLNIDENYNDLLKLSIEKVHLEDTKGNEITELEANLVKSGYSSVNSNILGDMLPILKITCRKSFQESIRIKKITIDFKDKTVCLNVDFSLNYNNNYNKELSKLPSYSSSNAAFWTGYSTSINPWLYNTIEGNYIFFDFYNVLNKQDIDLVINNITIQSESIIEKSKIKYGIIGENEIWRNAQIEIESKPTNSYIKGTFDGPINFKDTVSTNNLLFMKLDIEKTVDKLIYTNIVYDITFNGKQYQLLNEFVL